MKNDFLDNRKRERRKWGRNRPFSVDIATINKHKRDFCCRLLRLSLWLGKKSGHVKVYTEKPVNDGLSGPRQRMKTKHDDEKDVWWCVQERWRQKTTNKAKNIERKRDREAHDGCTEWMRMYTRVFGKERKEKIKKKRRWGDNTYRSSSLAHGVLHTYYISIYTYKEDPSPSRQTRATEKPLSDRHRKRTKVRFRSGNGDRCWKTHDDREHQEILKQKKEEVNTPAVASSSFLPPSRKDSAATAAVATSAQIYIYNEIKNK